MKLRRRPGTGTALLFAPEGEGSHLGWPIPGHPAGRLMAVAREEGFRGRAGQVVGIRPGDGAGWRRVIVSGLGPRARADYEAIRRAAGRGAAAAASSGVSALEMVPPSIGDPRKAVSAMVEGALLSQYRFLAYKSRASERDRAVGSFEVLAPGGVGEAVRAGLADGLLSAGATAFARDLANEPAEELSPAELARRAGRLGSGVRTRVMAGRELGRAGLGAVAGVGRGSRNPPVFITISYRGPSPRARIALVGKGVCFDSGGISLKPSEGMHEMKGDMAGAAAVMAAIRAVAGMKLPLAVEGFIPAVENMPDGGALKPGDVVRVFGGLTVEVQNTDAEGRLILADALGYALRSRPDHLVDVATLTGAARVALGRGLAGLMGNDPALKQRLMDAGRAAGEPLWELPLVDDYREDLKSGIADLRNMGRKGEAGTIIGGLFLSEFVGKASWAHMDIASVAWTDRDLPYCPAGSTGVPARTLIEFMVRLAGRKGAGG